jgi:hypothetical protein
MILMGLLSDILLLPVTGPVRGLHFIFEQVREQVDEEQLSESSNIADELMSLTLRCELGEISEQEYAEQETALLERLNEIRSDQEYWQETEETASEVDDPPISSENSAGTDKR